MQDLVLIYDPGLYFNVNYTISQLTNNAHSTNKFFQDKNWHIMGYFVHNNMWLGKVFLNLKHQQDFVSNDRRYRQLSQIPRFPHSF